MLYALNISRSSVLLIGQLAVNFVLNLKAAISDRITVHDAPSDWKTWKVPTTRDGRPFSMAVVVSFGYLIPTRVLEHFQFRAINMHPSLLPRHRGAAPIIHTILQRDKVSGISVTQLSAKKFDAGKILLQRKMEVPDNIEYAALAKQLAEMGAVAVVDVLSDFDNKLRDATSQDESLATKAPKVSKEDGLLRFDCSAEEAYTRWRALNDNIGIFAWFGDKRQRILFPHLALGAPVALGPPGEVCYAKEKKLLQISCASGSLLCNAVQVAGKAVQSAGEFANGYLRKGAVLQLYQKGA